MPVLTRSVIHRLDESPRSAYSDVVDAALNRLFEKARDGLDGDHISIRDIKPSDIGLTNEEWTDSSGGSDNAYANTTATGAGNSTAAGKWLVIWGCRLHTFGSSAQLGPFITQFRFTVAQSIRALWNLYPLFEYQNPNSDEAGILVPPAIFTESPLQIAEEEPLQIEHYTIETSVTYNIEFLGAAAEKSENQVTPQDVPGIDTRGRN